MIKTRIAFACMFIFIVICCFASADRQKKEEGAIASDQGGSKENAAAVTVRKILTTDATQYRSTQELTFSCDKSNIGTNGALICAYQIAGMHDAMMVMLPNLKGFEKLNIGCYQNSYNSFSPLQQSTFLGKWLRENPDAIGLKPGAAFLLFWLDTHPVPDKCWNR